MLMMLLPLFALAAQPATSPPPAPPPALPAAEPAPVTPTGPDPRPYVALVTDLGTITVRLEDRRAPVTAKNFLRYFETRRIDGFQFHRSTPPFLLDDHRYGNNCARTFPSRGTRIQ